MLSAGVATLSRLILLWQLAIFPTYGVVLLLRAKHLPCLNMVSTAEIGIAALLVLLPAKSANHSCSVVHDSRILAPRSSQHSRHNHFRQSHLAGGAVSPVTLLFGGKKCVVICRASSAG